MSIKKAVVLGVVASAVLMGVMGHAFAQASNYAYSPQTLNEDETMVEDQPSYEWSPPRPQQQPYIQQYRPVQPPVYQPPAQYRPDPYAYAPPPVVVVAPAPVYVPPPPGAVVYAPGVPPALATGYWPRGYNPYRAPRPYGGRTYGGYAQPSVGITIQGNWR
jgi:hypothetical protein